MKKWHIYAFFWCKNKIALDFVENPCSAVAKSMFEAKTRFQLPITKEMKECRSFHISCAVRYSSLGLRIFDPAGQRLFMGSVLVPVQFPGRQIAYAEIAGHEDFSPASYAFLSCRSRTADSLLWHNAGRRPTGAPGVDQGHPPGQLLFCPPNCGSCPLSISAVFRPLSSGQLRIKATTISLYKRISIYYLGVVRIWSTLRKSLKWSTLKEGHQILFYSGPLNIKVSKSPSSGVASVVKYCRASSKNWWAA